MRKPAIVADNQLNAGLGNRIRFTLSAQCVAEAEDRAFYWIWPRKRGVFEPRFQDLWHYGAGTEITRAEVAQHRAQERPFGKDVDLHAEGMAEMDVWHIRSSMALPTDPDRRSWDAVLRELRPVDAISDRIETVRSITPLGAHPYVGVMVRASERTHHKTVAASPVEWYLSRMRSMLEHDPATVFFLSCDNTEVQEFIQTQVPHVYALTDKGSYNTLLGVQSAVTDLYLLAGANHILAPHWSSFPILAWLLSDRAQPLEDSHIMLAPGSVGREVEGWSEYFLPTWTSQ